MKNERSWDHLVASLAAILGVLFIVACQPSQTAAPPLATESKPATTSEVFVVFEGPWAIVPDPKDSHSILAIAPKTKSHRPLVVVPANTSLEAGVYDLSIPARPADHAPEVDNDILRANIDPQVVQRILDKRTERFVVRLPVPEAYVAETRHPSRVSAKYPPEPSGERNYASALSLRYTITSTTGFQLAGTPDVGAAFKPALLELKARFMRFSIDPLDVILHDECEMHARQAFHDLVRLVGLNLYVDFPESNDDCRKKDPQMAKISMERILGPLPWERELGAYDQPIVPQVAGVGRVGLEDFSVPSTRRLGAALFFASDTGACKAPIILGGP